MSSTLQIGFLLCLFLIQSNCFITFYQLQDFKGFKMNYTDGYIKDECKNLHANLVGKSNSLTVDGCFRLYDERNCSGSEIEVQTWEYETLDDFKDKTLSFEPCPVEQLINVTFFKDSDFAEVLYETQLAPGDRDCHILSESIGSETKAFKSEACVVLFANANCNSLGELSDPGSAWEAIQPGQTSAIFFQEGSSSIQSFQNCWEEQLADEDHANNVIQFFSESDDDEDELELFMEGILTEACTNLPKAAHYVIQAVDTKQCVNVYSDVDCEGESFTLRPSGVKLLEGFNAQTVSFSGCDDLQMEETGDLTGEKIVFFEDANFTNVLFNGTATLKCETLNESGWGKASSIKTEASVGLYSLPFCEGVSIGVVPGKSDLTSEFNNRVASFVVFEENEENEVDEQNWDENGDERENSGWEIPSLDSQQGCAILEEENQKLRSLMEDICSDKAACPTSDLF